MLFSEIKSRPLDAHDILGTYNLVSNPNVSPGRYKERSNRVGDTHFVHPDLVSGTLAEVHPFVDGNGRLARIMMNAELTSSRLATILIPNVYRDDYLTSLRALARAQKFSHLEFSPYKKILKTLEERNWFLEPTEAKLIEDSNLET